MNIADWKEFYDTLAVTADTGHLLPPPTSADLDTFEAGMCVKSPKSYRDFILVFGPGEFSSSLRIAAPGYTYRGVQKLWQT